jgi:hypothetical protein
MSEFKWLEQAKWTLDLADRFALLEVVKVKLLNEPDPAADDLVTAIEELGKIYSAMDDGLQQYMALRFYEGQDSKERQEEREILLAFQGGQTAHRMRKAKTHCKKILGLYRRSLSPWFSRTLDQEEQIIMRRFYEEFEDADYYFADEILELAEELSKRAKLTLDLLDAGEVERATEQVRNDRVAMMPLHIRLQGANSKLTDLENDFIDMSSAQWKPN